MNHEKMAAVIAALPKCEKNCKHIATQAHSYYECITLLCDFHAAEFVVPDFNNTGKFLPDPSVGDLPYATELRALFTEVEVPVIHEVGPII